MVKSFGDTRVVRDVSFQVRAGEILGLLGPNGAGKTTTVKMLTTLLKIDGGAAQVGGYDVATQPDVVRQLIGVASQGAAVDEKLTARENLELFAKLYKLPADVRAAQVDSLIERFDMSSFADRPAETYSGGQRRRLDVAAALVAEPPVLILDEPTTGLDPRSRAELWAAIRSLADQGTAILLTTQYLDEADNLADYILIIDEGVVVAQGTPQSMKKNLEQDVLQVQLADEADAPAARAVLSGRTVVADTSDARLLQATVGHDPTLALQLLREMQDAGVQIVDFQLRRPTLDDVFLSLTANTTQESSL